ncbi:hypothetical protein [Alicyclobacillus sp. ALC3]|uniref:hypothetical protein n=1 Tax=Alicyclobacillus sp. ALC3 TaxID=2796143 RepID=UPI0023789A3C|nr:hypothetical protein [Alicyclobacillus sp. ALC3]WDL97018.1 hypothetical protein JC200_22545 [Alicyclobacillus sp. ALC3]
MIRALGAAMVLAATSGIGWRIAGSYRRRPAHLRALAQSVRLLQAEVEYSVMPLPEALRHVAMRADRTVAELYRLAGEALANVDVTVADAFRIGIDACTPRSALRSEDFDVMRELGATLGTSDSVHQSQQLDVALARLNSLEAMARELQQKNERMWQYLGVLSGLLIVILLY